MASMSLAHLWEYLFVARFHTKDLAWKDFLIDQSKAYVFSFLFSQTEFWLELSHKPVVMPLVAFGVVMILFGHLLRIGAMFTAAKSFTHLVQHSKRQEHTLVTEGLYNFIRHPSYLGWSLWAIGTQIVLLNPVSFVLYIFATVKFFNDRIPYEEMKLFEFFGTDYINYAKRTRTWMPFVDTWADKLEK